MGAKHRIEGDDTFQALILQFIIEVAIRRLRAKVDDPFEPKLIRTARGMGYVLEVPDHP